MRERLVGCWRRVDYKVTAVQTGETNQPLGTNPLGTILYTPDGYMSAQMARSGADQADEKPDARVRDGVMTNATITWSRQPPHAK